MECRRTKLSSKGGLGGVEQCTCGSIHLTIGAVTLRLTPGVMPLLAEMMVDAATALTSMGLQGHDLPEAWS